MASVGAARLGLAIVALGAAVAASGCTHRQTVGSDHILRVALTEYRLNPQDVRATAGTLTILVRNYGRLTHNLVVSRDGQSQGSTKPLAPGESAQLILNLSPGRYSMFSTILSDLALGEYGTLSVTS